MANGTGSTKQQKCDMCRNHGEITSKRAHKNACPYQSCTCALCNLTRKRRDIMRHQQRVRRSQVTSKQHNEAWEYVIQATAELEFLSFKQTQATDDQNATSSSASASPSPDSSSSTSASLSLKLEVMSSNSVTPPTPVVTTSSSSKITASSPVTPEMPPLELLPECSSPRYSPRPSAPPPTVPVPTATSRTSEPLIPPNPVPACISVKDIPVMEGEHAWKNLKRERDESLKWSPKVHTREENLFGHLDFMRGHQTLTGRLEPPVPMEGISFHDTISAVDFGSSHMSPFKGLVL
uniref:Doublesex and mab-3 related transcription factor 1b n=1 Tax=Macrobrachium rosenbergii TaxID=79674 RepID=A0A4Y5WS40_MACRS|nr:doublesex and mab-3 related transcription factor 1b [Macrobrachium rosenbergii]